MKTVFHVYSSGVVVDLPKVATSSCCASSAKRGKIHGLSLASVRRLRQALATFYVEDSKPYGVTLTVPWRSLQPIEIYKESFNRFTLYCRRSFPFSSAIFRHELQTRKQPHTHMVFWVHKNDLNTFPFLVSSLWTHACPILDGCRGSFIKYGVNLKPSLCESGFFRYLADHASKHKQSQLGFLGKQWGFINRSNMSVRASSSFSFDQKTTVKVLRQMSRLLRYCQKCDCIFGYRHLRRRSITKVSFINDNSFKKIVSYYSLKKIKKN